MQNPMAAEDMRAIFDEVYDVERLLSRIAYDAVNARECLSLSRTLSVIPRLRDIGRDFDAALIRQLLDKLNPLPELAGEA